MASERPESPVLSKDPATDPDDNTHETQSRRAGPLNAEDKIRGGGQSQESDSDEHGSREEFTEGGYGWYVQVHQHHLMKRAVESEPGVKRTDRTKSSRVVVLAVFLINMHTWGMNSAYVRTTENRQHNPGRLPTQNKTFVQEVRLDMPSPRLTLKPSQAVFLAYYLSSNTFPDATPRDFAFVGGLSISIGMCHNFPGSTRQGGEGLLE